MSVATAATETSGKPGTDKSKVVVVAAVAAACVGVVAGVGGGTVLGDRLTTMLLAAVVIASAAGLVVLALRSMEWFLYAVLALRASADAAAQSFDVAPLPGQLGGLGFSAMLVLATAVWFGSKLMRGERLRISPLAVAMMLLISTAAVSALDAVDVATSIPDVARLFTTLVIIMAVDQLVAAGVDPRRVLLAAMSSVVIPVVVGGVQLATGIERVKGTFLHANAFGFYIALMLVLAIGLISLTNGRQRLALMVFGAAMFVTLMFTYSRTAWLAAVAGLLVVGVLKARWVLGALLAIGLVVPLMVPSAMDRLSEVNSERSVVGGTGSNSLLWRFDFWQETLTLNDNHQVFGIGFGMTPLVASEELEPHNDFIRMYVESGLLGFAAYMSVLGVLCYMALKCLRSRAGPEQKTYAAILLACTAVFVVHSFGGNLVTIPACFWYFAAVAASLIYLTKPRDEVLDLRKGIIEKSGADR